MIDDKKIAIELGDRGYEIHIGERLLERLGALLSSILARPYTVVVTDENIIATQGDRLRHGLNNASIECEFIVLPAGEQTKSFSQLESLCERLLDLGIQRSDTIIAFGGGVIGDLTGFAASILKRGCRFIQIPTTLLAQVDSSIGGKTAINMPQGKNLIGAFYQPSLVLCDVTCLTSLSERERRAGYAEIAKYGLIDDPIFFDWLETAAASIIDVSSISNIINAVARSCEKKAAIVAADETERGIRALLNLGHTFGHALEAQCRYDNSLLHGEAVSIGMVLAFEYSAAVGLCPAQAPKRVASHLRKCGLPVRIGDIPLAGKFSADNLLATMMQDKKNENTQLALILARDIGDVYIDRTQSVETVRTFLSDALAKTTKASS